MTRTRTREAIPQATHDALPDTSCAERATVYRWLSGIFARELTTDALSVYRTDEGRALLAALADIDEVRPVTEMIADWLSDLPPPDIEVITLDLAGEFSRLFLGVGGRRGAPPYHSFYVCPEGRLMQRPAAEMHLALRDRETRIAEAFPEPPDHIAVQLALMADFVETTPPADQAAFLEIFLLTWIEDFRDRCEAAFRYGFYTCAATALVDFVVADLVRLRVDCEIDDAADNFGHDATRYPVARDGLSYGSTMDIAETPATSATR